MAEKLDRLMEWVVGVLGEAGTEGLSISVLFERLGSEFGMNDVTKNGVWEGLVTREDALLGDVKNELPLSKSPLKKLALEDIFALSLSERKICVRNQEKAAPPDENRVVNSTEVDVDGRDMAAAKRKASEELFLAPLKKRRGRPPKKRDDASQLPSFAGSSTLAPSTAAPVADLQTSTSRPAPIYLTRAPSSRKRTQTIKAAEELLTTKQRKLESRVELTTAPTLPKKIRTGTVESNAIPSAQDPLYVLDSAKSSTRTPSRSPQKSSAAAEPAVELHSPDFRATISKPKPDLLNKEVTAEPSEGYLEMMSEILPAITATVEQPTLGTKSQASPIVTNTAKQPTREMAAQCLPISTVKAVQPTVGPVLQSLPIVMDILEQPSHFAVTPPIPPTASTRLEHQALGTATQNSPTIASIIEQTHLPKETPTVTEKSVQSSHEEKMQYGKRVVKPGEQSYTPFQIPSKVATPLESAPLSDLSPTTLHMPAAFPVQEARKNGKPPAESLIYTPKNTYRPSQVQKRKPKKASPISRFTGASPKAPDERLVRHAVFTSQDDMDRHAGVSRVYIDPAGSQRPGVSLQRYGKITSRIAVFKSAKLKDSESLEKNKGSWVVHFAEIIAERLDEATNTTPQKRRKRNSAGEAVGASEGTPSKKRKSTNTADALIDSDFDSNREIAGDGSQESRPAFSSIIADQIPVQTSLANAITLSAIEAIPATQASEQNTVAASTSIPSTQEIILPPTTLTKSTDIQLQDAPTVPSQRQETCIVPPQNAAPKSATPPAPTCTSTSAKEGEAERIQTFAQILQPPPKQATKRAASLQRVASSSTKESAARGETSPQISPPIPTIYRSAHHVWTNQTASYGQNELNSPSTATQQTPPNTSLAIPPNDGIQRIPNPFAAALGSQPAASLHLQSYSTAATPARAYISPYASYFETSTSPSTSQQSVFYQQKQSQWIPPGSSDKSHQNQGKTPSAQVCSVSSETAPSTRPFESTALAQPSEKPMAFHISTKPPALPRQSLLPDMFIRPEQPYKSPYASPYSSPYASKPSSQVYQGSAIVTQPVSLTQLSPTARQTTVHGRPEGLFSQESATLNPQLSKLLSAPRSAPNGRNAAPLAQGSVQAPSNGFFPQEPAHINPQLSKELFKAKSRRKNRVSASPEPADTSKQVRKRRLSEATSQADENQVQSPPRKHRSKFRQEDPELSDLSRLEAVTIQEGVTRLACFFKTVCGNLLLSKDLSVLEFFSVAQVPPESPLLGLSISKVTQNPIVSTAGSNPLELRIKAKDDDGNDVVYCFSYAETDQGSEAAKTMRAKIVTALIAHRFRSSGNYERPGDLQLEILKPWKCEKCEARFKNKGGLEYHLTKSATACNPNYDLTLLAEKKERAERRKRGSRLPKEPKEPRIPKITKPQVDQASPGPKKTTQPEIEEVEESDSSTSSEDSIIEFWKKNSTTGVERPRKVGFSTSAPKNTSGKSKVYKSLPFEASVLREVAEDITKIEKSSGVDCALAEGTLQPSESSSSSEIFDSQRCEEILVSLIHKNHHIFPGGRSIWIAFVGAWLKNPSGSHTLPESKLCSKAVDCLVERKELKTTEFTFIDAKKRVITRTILILPGRKVDSTAINLVKQLIQASHPAFYVPSQFAPPEPVLSKLNALATRTLPDRYRVQESADFGSEPTSSRSQSPMEINDEFSDDEFVDDQSQGDNPFADLGSDEDQSENEYTDGAEEADEPYKSKVKRGMRKRSAAHNKAIAEGVRKSWLRIKANKNGENFLNRNPPKDRVPLTQEEKDRRAKNAALRQRSWDFVPAFMPNPETGAWDQVPLRSSRKGRRHEPRPRLPEPITYMQAPNGTWAIRPFGHGVNPIYSRPARRAVGNPGFENYRRRIENGFRPVIYPTRNRMLGPAKPSKALLREMTEPNRRPRRPRSSKNKKSGQRISSRTGKPVREYRMRGSSESPVPSLGSQATGEPAGSYGFPRRVPNDENDIPAILLAGYSSRSTTLLDEVHLLNFFEPKKLKPDAQRNVGLDTIPPNFGLDASRCQGPYLHDYQPDYRSLEFIEPKIVEEYLEPGSGSWIIGAWTPFKSEDFNVIWDNATAFDMETIPYEELDFGLDNSEGGSPKQGRGKFVLHEQKLKKLTATEKYSFTRVLTSLPQDFEGVLENPQDAVKEFGIELGKPNEATLDNRRVKGRHPIMEPEGERRFIVTVIVIRTLTGGLDFRIDWVLVSQFFQEYSFNFLSKYWLSLQPAKKKIIDRIVSDFQEAFLPAYESGDVPRIDYEHLVDYDWKALIDWVMKNIDTTIRNTPLSLPGSKHEVKEAYEFVELDRDPKRWRESYFGLTMPTYKRQEVAAAEPYTVPYARELTVEKLDDLTLARSWVRAAVLTPQHDIDLDADLVKERLAHIGLPVVDEILKAFLSEKIIVKHSRNRTLLGRKYAATNTFFNALQKQHMKQKVFVQAVRFKRFLDEQFSNGVECVRSDYMANEGSIMITTTLHAQRRIRLVPLGVPMKKFGLTGGGYETKKIPKEKLRFDMDIYPTESYIFDSDNQVLRKFFERDPPRGPETGEIPLWYGISDRILPEIWKKVLVGVCQVVALRSGVNIAAITRIFKPTLYEWEIRILIEWGTEVGLFKRLHESIEGWTVGEEWWLLVGRTCVDGE